MTAFRHVVIFGVLGSGKTSLAWHITRNEHRLIIVDTAFEKRYRHAGVGVYSLDQVGEILERQKRFRIVYRSENADDLKGIFQYAKAARNMVVLVEEASLYPIMGPHAASIGDRAEDFKRAVVLGRHNNVKIVATTQRPAQIHNLLISQSEVLLGKVFETNDARYLRGFGGVTTDTIQKASALPDPKLEGGKLSVSFLTPLDNQTHVVQIDT